MKTPTLAKLNAVGERLEDPQNCTTAAARKLLLSQSMESFVCLEDRGATVVQYRVDIHGLAFAFADSALEAPCRDRYTVGVDSQKNFQNFP